MKRIDMLILGLMMLMTASATPFPHVREQAQAGDFPLVAADGVAANYLWPAMHPGTQAFNDNPENARLADDYAIVMGSSHCEQMLRNNEGEWRWNVLRGYASRSIPVKEKGRQRLRVYLLDPGIVLQEVLIHKGPAA